MLEPLRQEIDQPSASRVLLRRPFGRILLGHVAVPIAVLAAGTASPASAWPSPARCRPAAAPSPSRPIAVVPAIVLCAALSSRRGGRVPVSVLALGSTGDPSGGGIVIAWLLAWPAAAVVLGALPLVFVARAHALGSALVFAFAVARAAPFVLAQVLGALRGLSRRCPTAGASRRRSAGRCAATPPVAMTSARRRPRACRGPPRSAVASPVPVDDRQQRPTVSARIA